MPEGFGERNIVSQSIFKIHRPSGQNFFLVYIIYIIGS